MDPNVQLEKLLSRVGAKLVRKGKHKFYQIPGLPAGFTVPSTPSDHRSMQNTFSDLKRLLAANGMLPEAYQRRSAFAAALDAAVTSNTGAPLKRLHEEPTIVPKAQPRREVEVEEERKTKEVSPAIARMPMPPPPPPVAPPSTLSFRERLEARIRHEKEAFDRLMAEAQLAENRAKALEALLGHTEDAGLESVLQSVVQPPPPPPQPVKPAPVALPQQDYRPIIVTREIVRTLVANRGDEAFTAAQLVEELTEGRSVDQEERRKILQNISAALVVLESRGMVSYVERGAGRRAAIWQTARAGSRAAISEQQVPEQQHHQEQL